MLKLANWSGVFLFLGLLSASAPARAWVEPAAGGEQQVLRVTTDAVAGNLDVRLMVDDNFTITGLKYVSPSETKVFPMDRLNSGIVLMNMGGYDVVKLVSTDFDPRNGGNISVIYLNNGLTGAYRTYPVELDRQGQTWQLMVNDQRGRRVITRAYMKAKRVLGKPVGIDQITVN